MERSREEERMLDQREREAYAEYAYLAWCENRGLDPEDVGSMIAYDGVNPFHKDFR